MANQPQNQSGGGGNQPMGQKPAFQPVSSNGFGSSEPSRKPAQEPAPSVAKEQGTLPPYQSPKIQSGPALGETLDYSPSDERAQPEQAEVVSAKLPLFEDSGSGERRILTRGRVIAAIAVLLIASMYLDRPPANAPEDKSASADGENKLALIGAQAPGTSPLAGRVKVFFNNGAIDQTMACEKVFAVERNTDDPSPETALNLLFGGPATQEGNGGYFTSISPGVALKSVKIANNTAAVDVSAHLAWNVELGSCRAQAIRAQITETMKQFTGVKDVAILVDGKTDNIFAR